LRVAGGAAAFSAPRAASGIARVAPAEAAFQASISNLITQPRNQTGFAELGHAHPRPEIQPMTTKPDPKKTPDTSHPGMMGDGTEEQNLGQPGNPAARIKKDEVDAAFAKDEKKPK
jgi:hypothetical protein